MKSMSASAIAAAIILVGCTTASSEFVPVETVASNIQQTGDGSTWVRIPTGGLLSTAIAGGPGRKMWIVAAGNVYSVDMNGTLSNVSNLTGTTIGDIAVGPDRNLWFTSYTNVVQIVRMTTAGKQKQFTLPGTDIAEFICTGPDGNLWFTRGTKVDRLTPSGVLTETPLPIPGTAQFISPGPDGDVWFTVGDGSSAVGKIDPATLAITTYDATPFAPLGNLVEGHDGNLWTSRGTDGHVVRVTTAGVFTSYRTGVMTRSENPWLADGGDGTLYVGYGHVKQLVRYSETHLRKIAVISLPDPSHETISGDSMGPDRNLWTTDDLSGELAVYVVRTLTVSPNALTLDVGASQNIVAAEAKTKSAKLEAVSSSPAVASVSAGGQDGTFVVSGVASGSCVVTVDDHMGNSVQVPVTVN